MNRIATDFPIAARAAVKTDQFLTGDNGFYGSFSPDVKMPTVYSRYYQVFLPFGFLETVDTSGHSHNFPYRISLKLHWMLFGHFGLLHVGNLEKSQRHWGKPSCPCLGLLLSIRKKRCFSTLRISRHMNGRPDQRTSLVLQESSSPG